MAEHTHAPEPWIHYGPLPKQGVRHVVLDAKGGTEWWNKAGEDIGEIYCYGSDEQGLANARRIVAAVNACAGIPTEALERGIVKELAISLKSLPTQNSFFEEYKKFIQFMSAEGVA